MKRSTAVILIAAMLIAGWFTGRQLANPRTNRAAPGASSGADTFSPPSSAGKSQAASKTPARDFTAVWTEALKKWKDRYGPGTLHRLCKESAGSDPYAALAGIRQLKEIEASRHIAGAAITLLDYLFELWVEQHGWDAAFAGAKTLEGEERERALRTLGKEAIMRVKEPQQRLQELLARPDPDTGRQLVASSLSFWGYRPGASPIDPTGWLDSLPDGTVKPADMAPMERAAAQARLVKDPRGAAEWLMARATPESSSEHLQHIVARWVEDAPNACGEWLRTRPPGPLTDPAYEKFAIRITREDPGSAWQWAQRLSDPKRRDIVSDQIMQQWRVLDPAAAGAAATRESAPDSGR